MVSRWEDLPSHILTNIFRNLYTCEAYKAGLSCKKWFAVFESPQVWREIDFNFYQGFDANKNQLKAIENYGQYFRNVIIRLSQGELENRLLATESIKDISKIPGRQVQSLRIEFTGENPLFYGGQEFIEALQDFAKRNDNISKTLTRLDLSALPINFVDPLLYSFKSHFDTLQYLDLQNRQLVCQITPECMNYLVQNCPNITDLRVFHTSLSDEVIISMIGKESLKHLSILCRRQEKFRSEDLSEFAWLQLSDSNKNLAVSLKFDYTCPLWKVRQIMKENMPVRNLYLETYTMAFAELDIASDVYGPNLRKLVLQTQPSDEVDAAISQFVERSRNLTSLHVMCPLESETLIHIWELLPQLAKTKQYTLSNKHEEFFPWAYDKVLDEIRTITGWPRH